MNVFLKVDNDELWRRVSRGGVPAFFASSDPREEFTALSRRREPLYQSQADITIRLDQIAPDAAIEMLVQAVEEGSHGGE